MTLLLCPLRARPKFAPAFRISPLLELTQSLAFQWLSIPSSSYPTDSALPSLQFAPSPESRQFLVQSVPRRHRFRSGSPLTRRNPPASPPFQLSPPPPLPRLAASLGMTPSEPLNLNTPPGIPLISLDSSRRSRNAILIRSIRDRGDTIGYIHNRFVEHLKRFEEVFVIKDSSSHGARFGYCVTLHDKLGTPEERTAAVGEVIKCLVEEQEELIPGIQGELYPVTSLFGGRVYFSLERVAAPYFGIKAYGIHMNGFVESGDEKLLWVAKRSLVKPTYPGCWIILLPEDWFAPHGISCQENVVKECEEEAGIPQSISVKALLVGAVSYVDIDGDRFKRDVLFCYDLKLPESFVPKNQDGEVEGFNLMPVGSVAHIVRRTHFYKPNCSLVVIDFLFRHGYICPESLGYLDLLQSLRSGNCS
ncbi:unnamed protein product [Linum tenue]|uniref:Nudix hydrolase domain-containing protein n=1 Tax=Linum tenue TaxID=586396 RepID=A0AAV0S1W3_9ROSI|nr:unnamed protein product [Linum tenue]